MIRMALVSAGLYLAFATIVTLATLALPVALFNHIAERIGGL